MDYLLDENPKILKMPLYLNIAHSTVKEKKKAKITKIENLDIDIQENC